MKKRIGLLLAAALAACAAVWMALRGDDGGRMTEAASAEVAHPVAPPSTQPVPAPGAQTATQAPKPAALPASVPENCTDASGRVRRTVFPAPGTTLSDLRAAIAKVGGETLGWNPEGGYDTMLPRDALSTLRGAGCRLTLAPLPVTPALRRAVTAGGTLKVALACANEATAARLQTRLGGVRVGPALQAETSAEALATAFSEEGGILGADVTYEARFCNNVARTERFLGADTVQGDNAVGLSGAGEIVAVADSGLSSGVPGYLGQEGGEAFHPGLRGRVMAISPQPWEAMLASYVHRIGVGYDWSGHGTHVTGSILGDGTGSKNRRFRGVAPGARVFFQSFGSSREQTLSVAYTPPLLDPVFEEAYAAGARIHSNSWGGADSITAKSAIYSLSAWSIDRFVWSHRDFLPLFAAGNAGTDTDTDGVGDLGTLISVPAMAKNCLTIGAAETYRPPTGNGYDADGVPSPILNSNFLDVGGAALLEDPSTSAPGDNPDRRGVAVFSCRGPLPDGRVKPDLITPGTQIVSAHREGIVLTGSNMLADPATEDEQKYYRTMSGTSMATPLAAGSAAVARQWCREALGVDAPGQALLRALLLLGSQSIYPGQFGEGVNREIPSPAPNGAEGFGLLSLPRAFAAAHTETFDSGETGFVRDFPVEVTAEGTLRAVLTWVDYPAQLYAARTLVNDLDLELLDADGAVVAYPNGLAGPDRVNVAERIESAVAPGTYTLRVRGHAVPFPGGPVALVCSVPGAAPTPFIAHDPIERLAPGEAVALQAALLNPVAEGDALTLETSSDGATWSPTEGLTLTDPQVGRFLYRLRAGETVAGPYAVTVGKSVSLTIATEGPFFPATPAIGQTLAFAAGEIVTATARPVRAWAFDDATLTITSEESSAGGWTLTDAEGHVLDLGVGDTATFAMPAAPATLTWTAEAPNPEDWRSITFDTQIMLCRVGDRFVLPAPDPKPSQGRVVTGVWLAQDGTRHRAGEAYGPVTESVFFRAEYLLWHDVYFPNGDYDPNADPDGDGYVNAAEALDLTDPNDPASRPTPPTLSLFADPPVQTPCESWAGRFARFGGVDAESTVTLLAQTRLPGGGWGTPVRGSTSLRIVSRGPQTEYRVGVADALGVAFLDGLPGGRADHVVWSDVYTLECTDTRRRLAATLAADGTLTLRNVGSERLEVEVIPAVFQTESEQPWEVEDGSVTADAPFTWELPWLNGLPANTKISIAYTHEGEEDFFLPTVYLMDGETQLANPDIEAWNDTEPAEITLKDEDYPTATALRFLTDSDPYTVHTVTLSGQNVWISATAEEASPIDPLTVEDGGTKTVHLSFVHTVPSAARGVFIRSNDPVEPRLFLHWPRLGYRLRLR